MARFDVLRPMQVGGQAVIEGVMIRGPRRVATAVRQADGEIVVKSEPYVSLADRFRLLKLPVVRGAVGLIEMMVIGIRTLNFSAEVALEDSALAKSGAGISAAGQQPKRGGMGLGLTVAISLAIGVAVFFVTPLVLTTRFFAIEQDPLAFNLMAGCIRIALFLAYLGMISLVRDIRRLFEYHGAEHKAVFAFELGTDLTTTSAAVQSRFHPRCGTSFLLIVMFAAILLFSLLDTLLITWLGSVTLVTRLVSHIPMIPIVGGISYEFIRLSAKYSTSFLGRILVAPGLWLQHITTREPDEGQLEVALAALQSALGEETDEQSMSPRKETVRLTEGYA
jgi:uncharacterized protein YqhQ